MHRRAGFVALLFLSLASFAIDARAAGVAPNDATPTQREQAQARFTRGRELFAAKRFDEAAAEFRGSYEIVASPNALLYRARCDRERGKLVEAYAELGRTATEAKELAAGDARYAKTAESAAEERDEIASRIAFVSVEVAHPSDATRVTIAGEPVARAAWGEPFPVAPGTADVAVETPGRPIAKQTIALGAGDRKTITIDANPGGVLEPAPAATSERAAPPPPATSVAPDESATNGLRTGAWIAGGVAAAGLATFAVAGLLSNATYSSLEDQCHGPCPAASPHDGDVSRGRTEQTIANVGLVAGVLALGAGVTLFVVSAPKADRVSLEVGPTWIGARARF